MLAPMLLVFAAQIEITPQDDLYGTLQTLAPGDEVIVHAGDYPVPGFVDIMLPGSEAMPIVIRAADGETPVIVGDPSQNALNISGTWYTLRGFEIVGGSHGVRLGTSAHAVLEDLDIHSTADVGISCNRPMNTYEDITIRRNHIHDTGLGGGPGEGMYLGCNDGACVMRDSLVEFNLVHDTAGGEQGDGIEFKTGSYNTVVRHNVVYNTKYPGITMYGTQGMPPNTVEGNVVWNVEDNGIQTVGDLILRNNIVFDTGASGIATKASQGEVVANLVVVHNTVIGAGDACYRGNNFDTGGAITVANNAFFCEGGTAIKLANGSGQAVLAGNAVVGNDESGTGIDGMSAAISFTDAVAMNVYPALGSPLIDAGDPQHVAADDFNCLPRGGTPDIGAYDYSAPENPGWIVQPGFKTCAGAPPDPDTDTDGETGSDVTGDPSGTGDGTGSISESATATDPSSDPSDPSGATGSDSGETLPSSGSAPTSGDSPTGDDGPSSGAGEGGETAATAPIDTAGDGAGGDGCNCGSQSAPVSMSLLFFLPIRRRRRR